MRLRDSISRRLLLSLVTQVAFLMAVLIVAGGYHFRGILIENLRQIALADTQAMTGKVEPLTAMGERVTNALANALVRYDDATKSPEGTVTAIDRDAVVAALKQAMDGAAGIDSLRFLSTTGHFCVGIDQNGQVRDEPSAVERRDWVAMSQAVNSGFWAMAAPEDADSASAITYSLPVRRQDGQRLGIAIASVSLAQLQQVITTTGLADQIPHHTLLLNRSGRIVAASVGGLGLNDTVFSLAETAPAPLRSSLRGTYQQILQGRFGAIYLPQCPPINEPCWCGYAAIGSSDLVLVTVFSQNTLLVRATLEMQQVLILALLILLLMVGVIYLNAMTIIRPLSLLENAIRKFGEQPQAPMPNIPGDNEISRIGRAFEGMRQRLQTHISNLEDTSTAKTKLEGEVMAAQSIQMGLLPRKFPECPEYAIRAAVRPANGIGGDIYDFFQADKNHLCLFIGDVSGEGIPAALFMAVCRTIFRDTCRDGLRSPSTIFSRVNEALTEYNERQLFVSAFCAVIDLRNGDCWYASAGHCPPLAIRRDGTMERLDAAQNIVLGVFPGFRFTEGWFAIKPEDILCLFTDGVTEARAADSDELFGESRLMTLLLETRQDPLDDVVSRILASIAAFTSGTAQSDDIAIMLLRFNQLLPPNALESPAIMHQPVG
jgi:sigma-B regulation protein RsbU (phosphoserine phosphatase)